MATVLFRTVIIYLLLTIVMRLMGKRQIGELEISDLITTFLISELASLPITDTRLPLSHAILPIIVLLVLEVGISLALSRFPRLKSLLSSRPTTLIENGIVHEKAMREARLSFDELFTDLRSQGVDDISQIRYAILEQNGKLTVIQKARYRQPNADQLHVKTKETGLFHIVIERGRINKHGLTLLQMSRSDVINILRKRGITVKEVYLMTINDASEVRIIQKEDRK